MRNSAARRTPLIGAYPKIFLPFIIIVPGLIAVLTVLVGLIALVQLPISLYPDIAPPEILLTARYPGADAVTFHFPAKSASVTAGSGRDSDASTTALLPATTSQATSWLVGCATAAISFS